MATHQLDEDERVASKIHDEWCDSVIRVADDGWRSTSSGPCNCGVPQRMLAEVAAKRAILDMHDPGNTTSVRGWCVGCLEPGNMTYVKMPCQHVRLLAAPYASRPGYRDEWRPAV